MILKKESVRKCIACDLLYPKKQLLRIVLTNENTVAIDYKQKLNGRGAYVCNSIDCKKLLFKKNLLNRAFKTSISKDIYNELELELIKIDG